MDAILESIAAFAASMVGNPLMLVVGGVSLATAVFFYVSSCKKGSGIGPRFGALITVPIGILALLIGLKMDPLDATFVAAIILIVAVFWVGGAPGKLVSFIAIGAGIILIIGLSFAADAAPPSNDIAKGIREFFDLGESLVNLFNPPKSAPPG